MENFEPKKILVPTDFSDLATHALEFAQMIATRYGSSICLLYADPFLPPPYFTSLQAEELAESLEKSKELAAEQLREYARRHVGPSIPVQSLIMEDVPFPAITNVAEKRNVDLIVMGTHGRSGFSRIMLGSVTERVLRETDRPVLTARSDGAGEVAPPRRIVCPVNFSEVAHDSLIHAVSLARTFGSELYLLHVVEPHSDVPHDEEMKRICEWVPKDVARNCHFQDLTMEHDPAERIIQYVREVAGDLVVVGAQHRRFSDATVIGSTTVRLTRHSPAPVLTVVRRAEAATRAA
ncbi:MAG: universal stress protein [Thermoanaerobaculia bacterium]